MQIKKILAIVFLPLLIVSFLHAQSVTELAKKEKERRAAIKGKKALDGSANYPNKVIAVRQRL